MTPTQRSMAYSILKIDYGWNGVVPAGCPDLDLLCEKASGPVCAARKMAVAIHAAVGQQYFRLRVDGKPNRRLVDCGRPTTHTSVFPVADTWISAKLGLPMNARHVLAIIEDDTEDDPFRRYRVRMLWRKMAHEGAFSGWWEEPGGGGLVREDLIIYWRELPAPPPEIAKHFTAPAILKKYGERFGDHYPALKTLVP